MNYKWNDKRGAWQLDAPKSTRVFGKVMRLSKAISIVALLYVMAMGTMAFTATQIDLGTQVKGLLIATNGGTNNAFFQVSGPTTSIKTYTLPDASTSLLTTNAAVTVAQGGTGVATLTAHGLVVGEGTSNVSVTSAGTATQCLTSNGASADPTFQPCPGTALNFAFNETPTGALTGTSFTLAHTPSPSGSLILIKNGVIMSPGGVDYTLSTATITTVSAPGTGNPIVAIQYTF